METKNTEKSPKKFICEKCDFTCSRLSEWNIHIARPKHTNRTFGTKKNLQTEKINCDCGRNFVTHSGLWKHRKVCNKQKQCDFDGTNSINFEQDKFNNSNSINSINSINNNSCTNNVVILNLLKQNQEFKDLIIDQNKQLIIQNKQLMELAKEKKIIVNSTTNNKFNMNFFLNEQCKDALNIMDFVNSLKMNLNDLDTVGKIGYIEGISKIFIRGLKELDIFKRPIHCCDLKREIIYVKDQDLWEKENDEKEKIRMVIKHIADENIKQIPEWIKQNPESNDYETKKHLDYIKILGESMNCYTDVNDNKIIRNVSKEVVICKNG